MTTWKQVAGDEFDAAPAGERYIWISDGVLGYARPMADGETVEQATADFESAGELAVEIRVSE